MTQLLKVIGLNYKQITTADTCFGRGRPASAVMVGGRGQLVTYTTSG